MHTLICWIAALAAASPLIALTETNQDRSAWKEGPLFPVPDHDITGATLGSSFYVAGGCAVAPAEVTTSYYDKLWVLDSGLQNWRVAATLPEKRFYCATVAFDKKIWIISGSIVAPDGTTHPDSGVRIYDPSTGNMGVGPSCLTPRSMPLALVANNRIYLMGNKPGGMESIGLGEKVWRTEPNPPPGDGPLAGASLNEKIFVMMPCKGLEIFDPPTGVWETVHSPMLVRSPQMTACRGEIWVMGGRGGDGRRTMIWNPSTREWRDGPALPLGLAWGAAGVLDNTIVLGGGKAEHFFSDRTYLLNNSVQQNR
jgi:hypothetical protein